VKRSLPARALHAVFGRVNKKRQWYEMPTTPLKALNLLALRLDLRDFNLFDTSIPIRKKGIEEPPKEALTARQPDGTWNDLNDPGMGSNKSAFSRNINPKRIKPEKPPLLHDPSARKVSLELMTRDEFKPAVNLNVLAAAWIQFENHNWFFHGRGKAEETMEVPLEKGDAWHETPMHVRRSLPLPAHHGRGGEGEVDYDFANTETHWWDGSQLYGSTPRSRRRCARSRTASSSWTDDGRCCRTSTRRASTARLHRELVVRPLVPAHALHEGAQLHLRAPQAREPHLGRPAPVRHGVADQRALMAKIHTVEWTPGIVNTGALWFAMNVNWSGIFGQHLKDRFGRLGDSEIFSGIMGSPQEHHEARFQLTEEFVSVYRMHPLVRDDWKLSPRGRLARSRREVLRYSRARFTRDFVDKHGIPNLIYSMGVQNPGAITLHNYPAALQRNYGGSTASGWTSPRWTSCATASAASRATTISARRCGCRGSGRSRSSRPTSTGPSRSGASTRTTSTASTCRWACTRSRCRQGSASRTRRSGSSS
jgi:hypothetical protein